METISHQEVFLVLLEHLIQLLVQIHNLLVDVLLQLVNLIIGVGLIRLRHGVQALIVCVSYGVRPSAVL